MRERPARAASSCCSRTSRSTGRSWPTARSTSARPRPWAYDDRPRRRHHRAAARRAAADARVRLRRGRLPHGLPPTTPRRSPSRCRAAAAIGASAPALPVGADPVLAGAAVDVRPVATPHRRAPQAAARPVEAAPRPVGSRSAGRSDARATAGGAPSSTSARADHRFADELVAALADLVDAWQPDPRPDLAHLRPVAARPDAPRRPRRSPRRRARPPGPRRRSGGWPTADPRRLMANSTRQHANVLGAFAIDEPPARRARCCWSTTPSTPAGPSPRSAPCCASRGCPAVHPLAVADGAPS